MTDYSAETTQLLDMARSAGGLSDARRARIKTSVLTQVAAVGIASSIGVGGASFASAAGAGKSAGIAASLVKVASAVVLLAATGAGVYVVSNRSPAPAAKAPTAVVTAANSKLVARGPEAVTPPALNEPAVVAPAEPAAAAPAEKAASPQRAAQASAAPTAVSAETLAEETRLIREADQALRAGNASRALTLLDEHQSRFPRGVLAPERSAERLLARCKLGNVDAKAAQAYLSSHPSSAFAARIRDACVVR